MFFLSEFSHLSALDLYYKCVINIINKRKFTQEKEQKVIINTRIKKQNNNIEPAQNHE